MLANKNAHEGRLAGFMTENEHIGETIAKRLEAEAKRPVRYEKVEPGNEWILPDREQRDLDASRPAALNSKKSCRPGGQTGPGKDASAALVRQGGAWSAARLLLSSPGQATLKLCAAEPRFAQSF